MAFFMSLFIALGGLCIPLLATQLDASNLELGIIGSVGAAMYALTTVSAGALSDKIGRKRVIIAGALIGGVSLATMPLSRAPVHLILLNGIFGAGMACFWPVLEAWLTEEGDAEQIRRGLGGFNVSWSIGGALGPLIGGFLYAGSSTLAFLVAASGTAFVAYLAFLHREPAILPVSDGTEDLVNVARNGPIRVNRSLLYAAWMANFTGWFAISEIRVLFPKFAVTLGMEPGTIGILIFILSIALTVAFFLLGISGWWHTRTSPLFCAQAIIILLLIAMTRFDSALSLSVVLFGLGTCFGVTYSYSLYFSLVGSLNKGAAGGRHEMVLGTGALLGPLMGGAVAEILRTQRAPYALGAIAVLVSLILQIGIMRKFRSHEMAQPTTHSE